MELDLIRGNCAFIKSGAAPSFVLRGGRLFKLRSRTVPIGIMPSADAERIAFRVEAGDIVIMMSDGVTQTEEDCPWLYDILCSGRLTQLTSSAKRIADEAAKRSQDDISVVLMRNERRVRRKALSGASRSFFEKALRAQSPLTTDAGRHTAYLPIYNKRKRFAKAAYLRFRKRGYHVKGGFRKSEA